MILVSGECGKFMFTIFFSRCESQFFKNTRLNSKLLTKNFRILSIYGSLCIIFFQFLVFDFLDLAKVYAQYRDSNNFIYLILEVEFGNNMCLFCTPLLFPSGGGTQALISKYKWPSCFYRLDDLSTILPYRANKWQSRNPLMNMELAEKAQN